MIEDRQLEETLDRLAGPVDRSGVWSSIEARAGVEPWDIGDRGGAGAEPRATTRTRKLTLRVAIYASVAFVLLAAVGTGSFVAVRNLTKPDFVLVINDETIINAGTTGPSDAISVPGGKWKALPLVSEGTNINCLEIDPSDSSVLYAGTDDGLFKSTDGAGSWDRLPTVLGEVWVVAIDPAAPSTVYTQGFIPGGTGSSNFLLRSDDGGATWTDLTKADTPAMGGYLYGMWFDTTSARSTVYMWGALAPDLAARVFRSADRGETWIGLSAEEGDRAQEIALEPQGTVYDGPVTDADTGTVFTTGPGPMSPSDDPSTVYAGTSEGVYKSTNGGQTWHKASSGLTSAAVWQLVPDPSSPSILYAATSTGIFKTKDGGVTWDMVLSGQGSVVLAPSSPSTLYALTSAGLFRSDDAGGSWTELTADRLPPRPSWWGPELEGLLLVAPQDPETVFAVSALPEYEERRQVFRSTDGGSSWSQVLEYGGSLVADPEDPSTLYASQEEQLWKSVDLGTTWTVVSPEEWTDFIAAVVVDPHAPSGVYVLQRTDSSLCTVMRSEDGGATWERVGLEGAGRYVDELVFDPESVDTFYVLAAEWIETGERAGIYRSTDGGATWENISGQLPLADIQFTDIVPDPAPGGALYVAADGGLFKWVPDDQ